MANQILSMNKLHLVLRLVIEGKLQRHISRIVEISRNTVDKYAYIFNSHPLSLSELFNKYYCKKYLCGGEKQEELEGVIIQLLLSLVVALRYAIRKASACDTCEGNAPV